MSNEVGLPRPAENGRMSVEETISRRRSCRIFASTPLSLRQLAQLLWCAQGVTARAASGRAAPSAGATYPIEVFVAVGDGTVEGLSRGVYRYNPPRHVLEPCGGKDVRPQVASAALEQRFLATAPVDLLIAADYRRTGRRYGERAVRYVHMEVGHVGQNVHLQCEALGLGTVAVGAFSDDDVKSAFGLPGELSPLYLMPVGHPC